MSSSSTPRVRRKHKPTKQYRPHNYRQAYDMLMEDFEQRCAYSLVHVKTIGRREMNIDHHNPKLKRLSSYENLFPAYSLCNGAKGDSWPTKAEQKLGLRFLNPCVETEYGHTIFEDPSTHELVGTTPAADYHIEMLDLNNPALVEHRRERSVLLRIINSGMLFAKSTKETDASAANIGYMLLEIIHSKIPPIPPPPP